jgi:hypothetical protein
MDRLEPIDWFAVGPHDTVHCTGVQVKDFQRHKAGSVYHAPATFVSVYASPLHLLRLREINRRLRERGLSPSSENHRRVHDELGTDWLPTIDACDATDCATVEEE